MKKLLAATLCMFVVAACAMGGAKRASAPAPASTGGADAMAPGASPKAELDRLYAEVEQERERMNLPEPQVQQGAPPVMPMSQQAHPTTTNDATCKPAPTDTCKTSCTLSDSICGNADKICKLAAELQPDDDATAKCTKATDTCTTAHTKCCGCM